MDYFCGDRTPIFNAKKSAARVVKIHKKFSKQYTLDRCVVQIIHFRVCGIYDFIQERFH